MHVIFTCAPTEASYQEILTYYVPNLNRVKRSTNGFYHEINSSACQEAMCLLRNMRKQFRVLTKRSKQQFGGYLHITSILCWKLQSSIRLQYYWMGNACCFLSLWLWCCMLVLQWRWALSPHSVKLMKTKRDPFLWSVYWSAPTWELILCIFYSFFLEMDSPNEKKRTIICMCDLDSFSWGCISFQLPLELNPFSL